MPMERYSSGSSLNRQKDLNSNVFDSSFGDDRNSGIYRSSPDLSHGVISHRRYSSADSMDGSLHSGHSRQGSDSAEAAYPTRRMSTQGPRKTSVSADPLQFIKSKGAQDLALAAEVQMRVVAESKSVAPVMRDRQDEDDNGWQSNLSSWKNRRKSQSERSYALKEELEQMEKEKEGDTSSAFVPKSYTQMQEERERRKSLSRKFYPIEDEDEESAFLPSVSSKPNSIPQVASTSDTKPAKPTAGVAPWARDTGEDNDEDGDDDESTSSEEEEASSSVVRSQLTNKNNILGNKNNTVGLREEAQSVAQLSESPPPSRPLSASRSKLSEKFRQFDSEDSNTNFTRPEKENDFSSIRSRNSASPDVNSRTNFSNKLNRFSRDSGSVDTSENNVVEKSVKNAAFSQAKDTFKSDSPERNSVTSQRATSGIIGPRNQNKIGNILKNFEQSESKSSIPKQGYNEKIDLSETRKKFEQFSTAKSYDSSSLRRSGNSDGSLDSDRASSASSEERKRPSRGLNRRFGSVDSEDDDLGSSRDTERSFERLSVEQKSATLPARKFGTSGTDPASFAKNMMTSSSRFAEETAPSQSFVESYSAQALETKTDSEPAALSSGYTSSSSTSPSKNVVEKTIRISQKANSDRGFGFILSGGADKDEPLVVNKVNLGSAADVCNLRAKDHVVAVNQTDVTGMTAAQVGDIVAEAVTSGNIELKVMRQAGQDEDDEEDEDFSSDEGDEDISTPGGRPSQNTGFSYEDQLNEERVWLQQQISGAPSNFKSHQGQVNDAELVTQPEVLPVIEQTHQIEVENRPTIALSRQTDKKTDDSGTYSPTITHSPSSSIALEEDSDGSSHGPPAILRKWQRQRQKEEYTYDNEPTTSPSLYKKISLNSSLPRRDFNSDEAPIQRDTQMSVSTAQVRPWVEQMEEWTQQQDNARLPQGKALTSKDYDLSEAKFFQEKDRMTQQYEEDMKQAVTREQMRKQQEEAMLQPEMDKARLLEERRAERRARIQKEASTASPTSSPREDIESAPVVPQTAPDQQSGTHVTSMMLNIVPQQQQQQQFQQTPQHGANNVPLPASSGGRILIDPRNRNFKSDTATPVEFQVRLLPQPAVDQNTASLLEAERERIRLEELRKLDEEKKRVEEDRRRKEEEELRKIREKEAILAQQEESLRQQREQFLREQEEFKRLREQQLQQQQQQQQQQLAQPVQQKYYSAQQQHPEQQANDVISQRIDNRSQNRYPRPRDSHEKSQASAYAPMPFTPHRHSRGEPSDFSTVNNTSTSATTYFSPPALSSSSSRSYQSSPNVTSVHNTVSSYPQPQSSYWADNMNQSRRMPQDNNISAKDVDPRGGKRFSRDEMLAMNRKATPLQSSAPIPQENYNENFSQSDYANVPITREAPSRGEKMSLNSAPKAKLRDDAEWYGSSPRMSARISSPRPQVQPKQETQQRVSPKQPFSGSQDHWLIQEAERRRMAESENRVNLSKPLNRGSSPTSHFSGPIKPVADSSNRWRDNNGYGTDHTQSQADPSRSNASMSAAIRQTLLQKTAGARGPTNASDQSFHSDEGYSHPSLNPNPSYHTQDGKYNKQSHPLQNHQLSQQSQQQPMQHHDYMSNVSQSKHFLPQAQPPTSAPPPPQGSGSSAVNGTQLCSHCDQELGFGAAMVIESLGLYFHVQCFRCCVCHASLGTGAHGADVRVRANKLHCPNCYSNDEEMRKNRLLDGSGTRV